MIGTKGWVGILVHSNIRLGHVGAGEDWLVLNHVVLWILHLRIWNKEVVSYRMCMHEMFVTDS